MIKKDITIRRAKPGDEDALSAIGAATFLESFIEDIPGPDLISHCRTQHSIEVFRRARLATDARSACWIAEYAPTGAPIGYAMASPPDLPIKTDAADLELKRIYVFSRFHGSGAGKQLNDLVDAYGKSTGCQRVLLGTYQENHRAVAFYKREGYALVGTRQFQVGDRLFDDVIMAKPL